MSLFSIISWIKRHIPGFRPKNPSENALDPHSFLELIEEMNELARTIKSILPARHAHQSKIEQIEKETQALRRLVSKPEFQKLSDEQLQKLMKNLSHSKNKLLEAVQTAPPPTNYMQ